MLLKVLFLPFLLLNALSIGYTDVVDSDLEPFTLDEYLNGTFSDNGWNGTWISGSVFTFYDSSRNIYKFDVVTHKSELFLSHSVFDDYLGSSITFTKDLKYALIKYNEKAVFRHSRTAQYTVYGIENKQYYDLQDQKHLQLAQWAPKDAALVYVYENNIYYLPNGIKVNEKRQITSDGIPGIIYNGVPDWVYEEEVLGSGSAIWFSPDAKYLAYAFFNDTNVQDFHYFLYGESTDQYPSLVTLKYPKVSTTNPHVALKYVDLTNASSSVIILNDKVKRETVSDDYVLQDVSWANDSDIAVVFLNRVQNEANIVRCNIQLGLCKSIYMNKNTKGWIELAVPIFNSDGSKYLMLTSESEGHDSYKHLSLIEDTFANRKRLTFGKRIVSAVYGWDWERNLVYYVGSVEYHQDQQQVYVVDLNSFVDRCLTCDFETLEGPCTVASASFSKGFSYSARQCSGPGPRTVQIQNLKTLEYFHWQNNYDVRYLLSKKLLPIKKNIKVALSSGFIANAKLLLPPELDENASIKYPLIVEVYAGPNSNQISDGYSTGVQNYFVTNRKYIYAYIDGRGSGKNGDNNMFQIYRKLGTVEIADQIEITKFLQEKYKFIDSDATGIWGWSYGGFATLHTLVQDTENVFKFGLSVAPVTNFILYDSIYTERYMGLNTEEDNMEGYIKTDVSKSVEAFRNKTLYLLHGNADDNVHYQHSMLLAKALERADIMFFQQSYPDENHGLGSVSPHVYHTIDKFFDHGVRSFRKGNIWKLKKNTKLA